MPTEPWFDIGSIRCRKLIRCSTWYHSKFLMHRDHDVFIRITQSSSIITKFLRVWLLRSLSGLSVPTRGHLIGPVVCSISPAARESILSSWISSCHDDGMHRVMPTITPWWHRQQRRVALAGQGRCSLMLPWRMNVNVGRCSRTI